MEQFGHFALNVRDLGNLKRFLTTTSILGKMLSQLSLMQILLLTRNNKT